MGRSERDVQELVEALALNPLGSVGQEVAFAKKSLELQGRIADNLDRIATVLERASGDYNFIRTHEVPV